MNSTGQRRQRENAFLAELFRGDKPARSKYYQRLAGIKARFYRLAETKRVFPMRMLNLNEH